MAFCTHCSRRVYTGLSRVYASTTCVTPAGSRPGREVGSEARARPCRGRGRGGARVYLCVEVRVCVRGQGRV